MAENASVKSEVELVRGAMGPGALEQQFLREIQENPALAVESDGEQRDDEAGQEANQDGEEDDRSLSSIADEEQKIDEQDEIAQQPQGESSFDAHMKRFVKEKPPQPYKSQAVDWSTMFKTTDFRPEDFADIDVQQENKDRRIWHEKQEILFHLLKDYPDEARGRWTTDLPLFELKYELMRRERHRDEQDQLIFMKDALKLLLKVVEMLNRTFGNFFNLDGWADAITEDMSKYDRCLRGIYKRFFQKKSQLDPLLELFWLIGSSAVLWHFQSKFEREKGTKRRSQHPDEGEDIEPPPQHRYQYNQPSAARSGGLDIASLLRLFNP
jgi:hypothetical protein